MVLFPWARAVLPMVRDAAVRQPGAISSHSTPSPHTHPSSNLAKTDPLQNVTAKEIKSEFRQGLVPLLISAIPVIM